jgi:integrase
MAKSKKYPGVYTIQGKKGISYGIDYINPMTTGQRVRKVLRGAKSEADAAKLRSIEIADLERGNLNQAYSLRSKPKPVPFKVGANAYQKWANENLAENTANAIGFHLVALSKAFGTKLLSDITPWMIERYKMLRIKQKSNQTGDQIEKSTVNQELRVLNQIVEKSIEWGLLTGQNPMDKVKRFKIPRPKKPGALTADEVEAIRGEIKNKVQQDIVTFAYATGWRISEILALRWEAVDLEAGTAWIVDPKNKKSVEVELSDEALEAIKRQEHKQSFSNHIFSKTDGTPFKTIHKGLKDAAKRAGITLPPRKAWHIFRRSWATEMYRAGADVETVRVLGNWSDSSMPLWYAEAAGKKERRALLNRLPKLSNGRKMPEIEKVVPINPSG